MPYCPQDKRELYMDAVDHFERFHATKATAGEMTFFITALIHSWIKKQNFCYCTLCIAMGILFCTAFELYRVVIGPYESKKRIENGGVSKLDAKTPHDVR